MKPNTEDIIKELLQQNANLTLENLQLKSVLNQMIKEKTNDDNNKDNEQ